MIVSAGIAGDEIPRRAAALEWTGLFSHPDWYAVSSEEPVHTGTIGLIRLVMTRAGSADGQPRCSEATWICGDPV